MSRTNIRLTISLTLLTVVGVLLVNFGTADSDVTDPDRDPDIESAESCPRSDISDGYVISRPIPTTLTFAGEPVPLHMDDVRESLDREILVNSYWQSQTLILLKKRDRYFSIIEPILKSHGVPDDFKYLAVAESGLSEIASSPAGAKGLWQLMKPTANEMGLETSAYVDERYHIERSTEVACRYLKSAYTKFGSWTTVAAMYNAGRTGVYKQMVRQKSESYYDLLFGSETSRYLYRLLAFKVIFENPLEYGFNVTAQDSYPIREFVTDTIKVPMSNIADYAAEQGVSYKTVKILNPWLRDNSIKSARHKSYVVKLPVKRERVGAVYSK